MERLKKIISEKKKHAPSFSEDEMIHIAREYLQLLTLKFIFQSKFGDSLSFMGGTCLRICYDLKRYSEDLDFCLDDPKKNYNFADMLTLIHKELSLRGFSVSHKQHEEKVVQKAFIKVSHLGTALDLKSFRPDQKIHIKIEVDTNPILLDNKDRMSFFVNRFQEIFPILKHNLPTLFSGKILAILCRPYARGRDYYDLIWYLSQKIQPNLNYLNQGLKQEKFENLDQIWLLLKQKIQTIKPEVILKDISRFLEDPNEQLWIKRYSEVFEQLCQNYQ